MNWKTHREEYQQMERSDFTYSMEELSLSNVAVITKDKDNGIKGHRYCTIYIIMFPW